MDLTCLTSKMEFQVREEFNEENKLHDDVHAFAALIVSVCEHLEQHS